MIKIGLTDYAPTDKVIDIRDKKHIIKAKYAIGNDAILKYSLMSEHYIEISFVLNRRVQFKRSDYIEWEGEKYTLRADYHPEQVNKRNYQYTLKFEAVEMLFQDIQFYYLGQGIKESEWRLTGNPNYFLKYVVENANRYFGSTDFAIGTIEPSETKDITFNTNTNTFDALTRIAEEYESEWYLTGKTLHLVKKVSFGDEVDFETEVSVLSMKRQEGEKGTPYTRIVALGSTRNLAKNYRETANGGTVDAIYPKRLRIPANKGDVIDAYPDMSPDEVVEGTVIFDEVYPKRVGTVEAVGTIGYQDVDKDTGEVTKWNAYKIKDSGLIFKDEYLLSQKDELRLQFVSGSLNGMNFALKFQAKGFSKTDNSQYFEIVRNDDYGKPLPNSILKPNAGDKYVLYGFNIALISDQYVPAGEQKLYETATEWLQKNLRDTGVYECPTVIKHFMDNQMDLSIGQKVRLILDDEKSTNRSSRVMGFEKKLFNKYDAIYTVGDNPTYSRFNNIEKEIKELQIAGVTYESKGGNGVYLIKQFDNTYPSEFNAYSAVASEARYFNQQTGGTVKGDTIFAKNMQVQGIGISDVFQNRTFTAGQFGSGFQIKRDANGQSYMEVDNLLVRRDTVFNRLTIAEIKSVGGTILLSLASMILSKVEVGTSTWKCWYDTANATIPNDFAVGDQAICRKFTGKDIKYYWALVTAVGSDYIELSKTDKDGSGIPAIGDEVVQLGNRSDVSRQYAIMLSAYGSAAPSINQYAGINSYDLTGKEVTAISPQGNKFTGSFTVSTNGTTAPIYKERGVFVNGTTYYQNDRVSYLGSYWVCIVNTTITAPSETSLTWRKETAGQTDIDNAANQVRAEYDAKFIILDDKIASKVSQTDFNALGDRISSAESRITQQGDKIELTVQKVEDIRIGGRNLLLNSNFYNEFHYWQGYGGITASVIADSKFKQCAKIVTTSFDQGVYQHLGERRTSGKNYVISGYIKADTAMVVRVAHEGGNGTIDFNVTTEWQQFETQGVWYSGGAVCFYAQEKGTFYLANIQYEEGNKATSWNPAVEDVQAGIDNAQKEAEKVRTEYNADFMVLNNQIASKVSQTDFNAMGDRISSAESKITQQSDKIESTVQRIDGIQVGGRNLLLNSNFYNGFNYWQCYGGITASIVADSKFKQCAKIVTTSSDQGIYQPLGERRTSGKNYVISGYIKADTPMVVRIDHEGGNGTLYFNVTTEWQQFETQGIWYYGGSLCLFTQEKGTFYLANIQYEEGNVRTSWQPAVEDVQAGIDNAMSKIEQTPERINLAVSGIQIGGRNLLPYTNKGVEGWCYTSQTGIIEISEVKELGVSATKINTLIASTGWHVFLKHINGSLLKNNTQYVLSMDVYCEFDTQMYVALQNSAGLNTLAPWFTKYITRNTWIHVEQVINTNDTPISDQMLYISGLNQVGAVIFANLKLEEGNKATSWSPAVEDVQGEIDKKTTLEEVASSLSITGNKISLASKTIELTGHTIAKSIEAQDLIVGNRDGLSALEVLKDGTFYAKGSKSDRESMIIDSSTQTIEIISPYSATGVSSGESLDSPKGRSIVSISSKSGGVKVRNDNNDVSIVSANGIFANKAGQSIYPAINGFIAKASIVGIGYGSNIARNPDRDYDYVAGVYGRASNSGTAPAYGGYFDMLRANGLVLGLKIISGNTTIRTDLEPTDSLVIGSSNTLQIIYLPNDVYDGTIIWFKQWWAGYLRIYPNNGQKLYDDHSENSYIDVDEGWVAMCVFIGNSKNNGGTKYPTWLISKFRF